MKILRVGEDVIVKDKVMAVKKVAKCIIVYTLDGKDHRYTANTYELAELAIEIIVKELNDN